MSYSCYSMAFAEKNHSTMKQELWCCEKIFYEKQDKQRESMVSNTVHDAVCARLWVYAAN